jgi:hypothetical protein
VPSHHSESPVSRIPELKNSNCHVHAKEIKWFLIAVADASLSPHAVVIQFVNALTTAAAMGDSGILVVFTKLAVPFISLILWIVNFIFNTLQHWKLFQFFHFTFDSHCLEIAPQTHKDIEVRKKR